MNDDQMDELLIQGARDYNAPGAVPRDEMWTRIAAERRARRRVGASPSRPSPRRVWSWPSVGIAAAALIAVGIGIGRRLERQPTVTTVAEKPVEKPAVKPKVDSTKAPEDGLVKSLHDETRKTDETVRRLAQSARSAPSAEPANRRVVEAPSRSAADATQSPDSRALAYRLVVLRHLAGSEALITSFRASAKRGEMDAEIAQWSQELLGTTRLLETSPAASDPVMKRLLEDLDLVIAQIAQYSARGTYNAEELDLIEQSINQRGVMTKLRSTTASSTTTHM
jgi:hypothetical protein